ncbi:MAG: class I SAM-dependent methyltransferase [Parvibaculum sp.]|uniref:class I SAM-dependent methyltransferase n=1 Tax=Parvibaculum sp. TaxID=2024848 RepID=UPI0025EF204B|nr:class I SAM-dependent methyltransferase [Parvibaculum sp.]MCE9648212.1 class I SAM-dependent methyltransferase [Parvibaculum sp.]
MTQNVYDNEEFFEGYSRLGRSIDGLDGAPEWPSLRALLPPLNGAGVVDLGCGFGWFCRFARDAGAAHVTGYDVSEKMLARARETTRDEAVVYQRADLETLTLAPGSCDLVYSSLAFHYIENLEALFGGVRRALRPGGRFVFSVEHPTFTAPSAPGWVVDASGRKTWPLDDYLVEGPRVTDWLAKGVVKQHRTIGTYINMLIARDFAVSHVEEWGPSDAQIDAWPALAEERQRPTFLLVAARV